MKVLITGGLGFIGSHTAEYFSKEGHEISIIDNLSSGRKTNLKIKHRFYNLSVTDKNCEEIFASSLFDVVVHLASDTDPNVSKNDPYQDVESNILGLINMLHLSEQYGVKKFIYASSSEVYGDQIDGTIDENAANFPTTVHGLNKLAGEKYCKLYREHHGLKTVCLRFSHVYGPRQKSGTGNSVIADIASAVTANETVVLNGSMDKSFDFIYVNDVVDAIFRSVDFTDTHTINISTNTATTNRDVIDYLEGKTDELKYTFQESNSGDDVQAKLDHRRAVEELNWTPRYDVFSGIDKTLEWFHTNPEKKTPKKKKRITRKKRPAILEKLSGGIVPTLENLGAFALVVFMTQYLKHHNVELMLDLRLLYIVIIGIQYGLKQVSISIVLSCIHFLLGIYQSGHGFLSLVYNVDTLVYFSMYIFIGSLLGYSIDNRNNVIKDKDFEMNELQEKFNFLYELYKESKEVRLELQEQIISSEDSFVKIYNATSQLDTLMPDQVFSEAIRVVQEVMKVKKVAIYLVSSNGYYLRLISKAKDADENLRKSIRIEDFPDITNTLEKKEVYFNADLKGDLPMLMAPIYLNDKPVALINIYDLKFKSISLYKINLMKTMSSLITSSLGKAYKYEEAIQKEKFIENTNVVKPNFFNNELASRKRGQALHKTSFAVLRFPDQNWKSKEIHEQVASAIREYDIIGVNQSNELVLLLSNTTQVEAEMVVNRFKEKGLDAMIEEDQASDNDGRINIHAN